MRIEQRMPRGRTFHGGDWKPVLRSSLTERAFSIDAGETVTAEVGGLDHNGKSVTYRVTLTRSEVAQLAIHAPS